MNILPVYHKGNGKLCQQDFMKNIWCPFYEECLEEAALSDTLMDCSHCDNSSTDFSEDWENRRYYNLIVVTKR